MEERLKSNSVGTWDPWFILSGFLSLVILFSFTSGFLLLEWVGNLDVNIAKLLLVLYCVKQYGPIKLSEFIPRGKDYFVLGIGFIVIFWAFGLTVGREGIQVDPDWQTLTGVQYGVEVLVLILITPLLEEIIFRRYFFEMLATLYSREAAFVVTVCIWTLLHWPSDTTWSVIFWHGFSGVVFTLAYISSRLGVPVLLHSFHNTMVVVLTR